MTPWRRRQPGSGAARSEPVFPTEREGPARGRRRHAVAAEALVPPGAARVAIRIATRVATVYTNAPKRHRGAILANLCTLLRPHGRSHDPRVATVYTNAPKRRRGAISTDLCTLLRRRPGGEAHVARAVTQPPTHTNSRSLQHRDELLPILETMLPGRFRRSLHHLPAVPHRAPRMGSRTPAPFWALSLAGLTPRAPPRQSPSRGWCPWGNAV